MRRRLLLSFERFISEHHTYLLDSLPPPHKIFRLQRFTLPSNEDDYACSVWEHFLWGETKTLTRRWYLISFVLAVQLNVVKSIHHYCNIKLTVQAQTF